MHHRDHGHQRHQHHGQGAGHVRVQRHIAGDQAGNANWQHVEVAGSKRIDRGVGAQGIGQQDHKGAEQGRGEHRQADMAPELPAIRTEQRGRFAPVFAQCVKGRVEQQYAERNLEIGIEDDQAGFRVQVEVLDDPGLLEHEGDTAVEPQQDDEREGQGHAGEIAGHVGEGGDEVAQRRIHSAQ